MNKIELLRENLIEENKDLALEVLAASSRLGIKLGWHYLLDLVWILKNLDCPENSVILDAGAGNGLLQFMLADRGYRVISSDVGKRNIPAFVSELYKIKPIGRIEEIHHSYWDGRNNNGAKEIKNDKDSAVDYRSCLFEGSTDAGQPVILYYHCDLENMKELGDNCIDAVVSVSALEHNPPDKVQRCMKEICRVVKPNGRILVTISTRKDGNGFHEPSHSWLLNEKEIVEAYGLNDPIESNFVDYKSIFNDLRHSRYLKRWLASFYYNGGNNGMPWGVWDPQYQPVGIMKYNK